MGSWPGIISYAISSALFFGFSAIRGLLSYRNAFACPYCAAREGGRLHTEHTQSSGE
jgi:hypothetical protein